MSESSRQRPHLPKIFCAVDTADLDHGMALAAAMQRAECGIKIGLEFFNAHGPSGIKQIRDAYPETALFIDLKYHDIPNTVAKAVKAIMPLEPDFLNVHASGGVDMMTAAKETMHEEADKAGIDTPKLLGVTILTSLTDRAVKQCGFQNNVGKQVEVLASLTRQSGLDGVVCSPQEIALVRQACGQDFILMVPGIRPQGEDANDQKRTMEPLEAIKNGADHLVIGRPITRHDKPSEAAAAFRDLITA